MTEAATMTETLYLVASSKRTLTHSGVKRSRTCETCDKPHNLHLIALSNADVQRLRDAAWSRKEGGGRKTIILKPETNEDIFVSANPACRFPGTTLRARTDKKGDVSDAGPVALDEHSLDEIDDAPGPDEPAESDAPTPTTGCRHLGDAEERWIVARIAELVRAHSPGFTRITRRLIGDLLRRWTSDGRAPNGGIVVEALWTDFDHLGYTTAALAARELRAFRHEHVVPVNVIVSWLLEPGANRSEDEILQTLRKICFAVLVHVDQDSRLPRQRMPLGWTVNDDVWARYRLTPLTTSAPTPTMAEGINSPLHPRPRPQ